MLKVWPSLKATDTDILPCISILNHNKYINALLEYTSTPERAIDKEWTKYIDTF